MDQLILKLNFNISLNLKLSNSQVNKLKSAIINKAEVVLRLSSNMIGDYNDETNFPYKLLLTNIQVTNLSKALQIIHQLILNYQQLSYLIWCN